MPTLRDNGNSSLGRPIATVMWNLPAETPTARRMVRKQPYRKPRQSADKREQGLEEPGVTRVPLRPQHLSAPLRRVAGSVRPFHDNLPPSTLSCAQTGQRARVEALDFRFETARPILYENVPPASRFPPAEKIVNGL